MALFKKKTSEEDSVQSTESKEEKKAPETKQKEKRSSAVQTARYAGVLLSPRITEKATDLSAQNAYVFVVRSTSTKNEVKQAVKELYGVDPLKVHTVRIPEKRVQSRRGGRGVKSGGKKAIVYLKEGDSIEVA